MPEHAPPANKRLKYWKSYVLQTHGANLESLLPLRMYAFPSPRGVLSWHGEVGRVSMSDGRCGFVVIELSSAEGRGWSEVSFAANETDAVREVLAKHSP